MADPKDSYPQNFIKRIIEDDLRQNRNNGRVITRFPPEPNGYLHIGHAKSITLNFGLAIEYNGRCHLRFDDTNPTKEDVEYVEAIKEDIRWLGYDWGDHLYYASQYFEQFYEAAIELIKKGKAYVCHLSPEELKAYRGTLTEPGKESPYRNRSVEENLSLFERMRKGDFKEGEAVLRAKIDMSSPNLNMRDPVLYRIMHVPHHRTGSQWCIYPTYDFAHPLSDAIEGITHSICTLEFEDHRPLYDWVVENVTVPSRPKQIEFARLNLSHTVMSKRILSQLVQSKIVDGWDDPRLPTISGLRRRGYTPESIKDFCERIGVAKANSVVDMGLLEHCLREDLNRKAQRAMVVLEPIKLVILNYPEDQEELLEAQNNPEDPSMGTRFIPFSRELFIESKDFMEDPPKKFYRLSPGREVRLRYAYYVKCVDVIKDPDTNQIKEIHCTYDPETKGGWSQDQRKVKATLHWVSARHAVDVEVRLYDRLFQIADPNKIVKDMEKSLNPNSLQIIPKAKAEPMLLKASPGQKYQFERVGYFCVDTKYSKPDKPVFNLSVKLKDEWEKIVKKDTQIN